MNYSQDSRGKKFLELSLDPKAVKMIEALPAGSNMNDLHTAAGWDADSKFKVARERMKLSENKSISHRFEFKNGSWFHQYREA